MAANPSEGGLPDPRRWIALAIVLFASFMGVVDSFIVYVSAPSIGRSLHANFGQLQLIIAGYTLTYGVGLVTGGRLGDIVGRKRVFQIGVAAFTMTSVASASAPNASWLIAFRFLQGLAAAAMLPQAISLIQVTFPQNERNRAFGVFGAVNGSASIAGQIMGGLLLRANVFGLGWRAIFMVNVPIGVVGFGLAAAVLQEMPHRAGERRSRLDVVGVVVLGSAVFLMIFPLTRHSTSAWDAASTGEVIIAAALVIVFMLHEARLERRRALPLVPLRLFRHRSYRNGLVLRLFFAAGSSAIFLGLAFYLQAGAGLSPLASAYEFTGLGVGFVASCLYAKRLLPRLWGGVVVLGGITNAVGLSLVAVIAAEGGPRQLGPLEIGLIIFGVGQGFIATAINPVALFGLKSDDAGAASGVLMTVQTIAASIGVATLGTLFISIAAGAGGKVGALQRLHHYGRGLEILAFLVAGIALIVGGIARILPRSFDSAKRLESSAAEEYVTLGTVVVTES